MSNPKEQDTDSPIFNHYEVGLGLLIACIIFGKLASEESGLYKNIFLLVTLICFSFSLYFILLCKNRFKRIEIVMGEKGKVTFVDMFCPRCTGSSISVILVLFVFMFFKDVITNLNIINYIIMYVIAVFTTVIHGYYHGVKKQRILLYNGKIDYIISFVSGFFLPLSGICIYRIMASL